MTDVSRDNHDSSVNKSQTIQGPGAIVDLGDGVPSDKLWRNTAMAVGAFVFSLCSFIVIVAYTYELHRELTTEKRLQTQAIDEKRMENRAAWKELGMDGYALEDHDISSLMAKVKSHQEAK